MTRPEPQIFEFDNFRLDAGERQLWREGELVALPTKAFDLLLVLLQHQGQLLEKEELYSRVWSDQIVEESNLTVQMSAIRKALGERKQNPRYIVTVAGRGYRFIGEVRRPDQGCDVMIEGEARSHRVIEKQEGDDRVNHPEAVLALADPKQTPINQAEAGLATPTSTEILTPGKLAPGHKRALALAALLAALALAGYFVWSRQSAPPGQPGALNPIRSIAVLPFKPLVAESRDEALEMGMADTLIARLSNLREIRVRPISAVRKYAGLEQDALAAGREQRVDAVLDGQIQKAGEKIRVTVRLARVDDGAAIWASQFDEKLTDIFAVQDSISKRVAGALAVTLSGEEQERLGKSYTENAEAYQLYLHGRFHLNRLTDDGVRKSLDYFQQAIDKDPNFALAHAGLADSYNALGGFNVRPPKEVFPKARTAALTALKLDDHLTHAHTALAMVNLTYDWDWPGAEKEFKRAIEINPGDSDAHYFYAYYLAFMGQFEAAITEIRKAQELDPLSLVKLTGVGQILLMSRRYDDAIEPCRKALELDPNLGFAYWLIGLAYLYKGSYEPAIQALQQSIPLSGDSPDEPATLAHVYALAGRQAEARKILDELKQRAKSKYISPGTLADVYSALGDKDQAFALLDKAVDERDNMVILLKVEPIFDGLRADPRFTNLLRRVGFPE
jgi:DNA-binding winged helix-turn-helix (wHTH) protein/TolB-like protein/Flp pilus assembly protein TadD